MDEENEREKEGEEGRRRKEKERIKEAEKMKEERMSKEMEGDIKMEEIMVLSESHASMGESIPLHLIVNNGGTGYVFFLKTSNSINLYFR